MADELEPDEMRVGKVFPCGHEVYERVNERGEVERGLLVSPEEPVPAGARGFVELGREKRPGVRSVERFVPFTAKGPAQVSSAAYRSGWDAVFGGKGSKPS